MKTRAQILNDINILIGANGSGAITGDVLNGVLVDMTEAALNLISDASSLGLRVYDSGKNYTAGEATIYNGQILLANKNTSGPFVAADWDLVSETSNAFDDWDNGTIYSIGDTRVFNTQIYRSLQNSNQGNQPDISPAFWEIISASDSGSITDWAPTTNYLSGQYVNESGLLYKCLLDHISTSDFQADKTAGNWSEVSMSQMAAESGVKVVSNNVRLGGAMLEDLVINGAGFNANFTGFNGFTITSQDFEVFPGGNAFFEPQGDFIVDTTSFFPQGQIDLITETLNFSSINPAIIEIGGATGTTGQSLVSNGAGGVVWGVVNSAVVASNGLEFESGEVKLGGNPLTKNTRIESDGVNFYDFYIGFDDGEGTSRPVGSFEVNSFIPGVLGAGFIIDGNKVLVGTPKAEFRIVRSTGTNEGIEIINDYLGNTGNIDILSGGDLNLESGSQLNFVTTNQAIFFDTGQDTLNIDDQFFYDSLNYGVAIEAGSGGVVLYNDNLSQELRFENGGLSMVGDNANLTFSNGGFFLSRQDAGFNDQFLEFDDSGFRVIDNFANVTIETLPNEFLVTINNNELRATQSEFNIGDLFNYNLSYSQSNDAFFFQLLGSGTEFAIYPDRFDFFGARSNFAASTLSYASLRVPGGVLPTTPGAGDIANDANLLKFYNGSAWQVLNTPAAGNNREIQIGDGNGNFLSSSALTFETGTRLKVNPNLYSFTSEFSNPASIGGNVDGGSGRDARGVFMETNGGNNSRASLIGVTRSTGNGGIKAGIYGQAKRDEVFGGSGMTLAGIWGAVDNRESTTLTKSAGVLGTDQPNTVPAVDGSFGGYFDASQQVNGSLVNYGIYVTATAAPGGTAVAGFFDGEVNINGGLTASNNITTSSGYISAGLFYEPVAATSTLTRQNFKVVRQLNGGTTTTLWPSPQTNDVVLIYHAGNGNNTIAGNGADTIDGGATINIGSGDMVWLIYTGVEWLSF